MVKEKSYNKIGLLSIASLAIFFLQFLLSPMQNILLMLATNFIFTIFLSIWMKDKGISNRNKTTLYIISILLISSFVFQNDGFNEFSSFILWFWLLSLLQFTVLSGYNILKNK